MVSYYTPSELEDLLARSPVASPPEQYALYDRGRYRFANIIATLEGIPIQQVSYFKSDVVPAAERALRTVIEVAIALYNTVPTITELIAAVEARGWSYVPAVYIAYAVLDLWFSIPTELGEQTLSNPSTFAATWTPLNGFSVAGGKLVYVHNAGPNTATQATGDFLVAEVGGKYYKLDYTISESTGTILTHQIDIGFALANVPLHSNDGKWSTYFISAAVPTDFVISATSNAGADFKIDDVQLTRLVPAFLDATGNSTVMTVEGKQRIADFAIRAVRELREGERALYGGNPVL